MKKNIEKKTKTVNSQLAAKAMRGTVRDTKKYRKALSELRSAKSVREFYNALYKYLLTPKTKTFRATRFDPATGDPSEGRFIVAEDSQPLYFYFNDSFADEYKAASKVRKHLVELLPKKGCHIMELDAGSLLFEYRQVITYSDHFNTDYAIQVVATVVRSTSSFVSKR